MCDLWLARRFNMIAVSWVRVRISVCTRDSARRCLAAPYMRTLTHIFISVWEEEA